MMRSGTWSTNSKTDKRWNAYGPAKLVGGFMIPPEAQEWIDHCKKKYGEPPKDLTWDYMKD